MSPILSDAQSWSDSLLYGLLLFALRATVLLAAAWSVTQLLRKGSAASRHLVWSLGLAGVLALPVLSGTLPTIPLFSVQIGVDSPGPKTPSLTSPTEQAATPTPDKSGAAPVIVGSTPSQAATQLPTIDLGVKSVSDALSLTPVVAIAWLIITLLLLTRLAVANARVSAWQRAAVPVQDLSWIALLGQLTRQYDIRRPVVLLESTETDVPVTWGIVYPVILIPSGDSWDQEQRVAVLTHELAHVKRFDALTQQLAQMALALLWYHPLVWMAVRRMRLEREHACDDFVLTSGARASRYADDLLGLARKLSRPTAPAAAALAMARRSELEGRLLAILDPAVKRTAVRRARVGALAVGVIALSAPLAAFGPAFDETTVTEEAAVATLPVEPVAPIKPAAPVDPIKPVESADAKLANPALVAEVLVARTTLDVKPIAMLTPIRAERAERLIQRLRATPADTEPQRPVELQTLIDVTRHLKRMTSDHDKGLLLQQIAKRYVRSNELRDAYLDAVGSMTSDHQRTLALTALLDRDSLDAISTARVLRTASLMTSDYSRGLILKRLTPATFGDTVVQNAYMDVLNAMSSSADRAAAIGTMVKQPNLSAAHRLALLRATTGITSSTEKANVLMLFLERHGIADPAVRTAFYKSAETLTSDSEYRRVMAAVLR